MAEHTASSDILETIREVMYEASAVAERKAREVSISSIAWCLRAWAFKIDKNSDRSVSEKALIGIEHHGWFNKLISSLLSKRGWRCTTEAKVQYGDLQGRVDIYCLNGQQRILIEVKYTDHVKANNPFLHWYRKQIKYYTAIDAYDKGCCPVGVLLVTSFTGKIWIAEVVDRIDVEATLREIEERSSILNRYLTEGVLPPKEKGAWCRFCRYADVCENDINPKSSKY